MTFRAGDPLIAAAVPVGKVLKIFNLRTSQLLVSLEHDFAFDGTMLSADAKSLIGHRADAQEATMWDVAHQRPIAVIPAAKTFRTTAAGRLESFAVFSQDGLLVATVSSDNRVLVFDARSGRTVATGMPAPEIRSLEFSRDGKRIVTAHAHNPVIRLWGATTGKLEIELKSEQSGAYAVFSMDGRQIAHSNGGLIQLSDTQARRPAGEPLRGGALRVLPPSGPRLVTMSSGTIMGWDLATGIALWKYEDVPLVRGLALSGDGRYLATVGDRGNGPARVFSPQWLPASRGPALASLRSGLPMPIIQTRRGFVTASKNELVDRRQVARSREGTCRCDPQRSV